jgi:hypothetical protein
MSGLLSLFSFRVPCVVVGVRGYQNRGTFLLLFLEPCVVDRAGVEEGDVSRYPSYAFMYVCCSVHPCTVTAEDFVCRLFMRVLALCIIFGRLCSSFSFWLMHKLCQEDQRG